MGRIAGVDALVTGRITGLSDSYRMTVKVLDSRTGEDLLHVSADVPRTRSLSELEKHSLRVVVNPGNCGGAEVDLEGAVPRIFEAGGLEVALLGCVRSSDAVHCLVYFTSRNHDRSVHLFGGSRIVLDDGRQVRATRVSVGMSEATGTKGRAGDVLVEDDPPRRDRHLRSGARRGRHHPAPGARALRRRRKLHGRPDRAPLTPGVSPPTGTPPFEPPPPAVV